MVLDQTEDVFPDYPNTWDSHSLPRMSSRKKSHKISSERSSADDWAVCTLPRRKDDALHNSRNAEPPPTTFEKRSSKCSMYMRYAVINRTQLRIQDSPTLKQLAEPAKRSLNRAFIMKKIRPMSVSACTDALYVNILSPVMLFVH